MDDTVDSLLSTVDTDQKTKKDLQKVAKDMQQGASQTDDDSDKMNAVIAGAEAQNVYVNPNVQAKMKKNADEQEKEDAVSETVFDLPVIDEDDLEEKKRRFSFSRQDFGRGIVTSPAAKLNRSARRGISLGKR